MGRKARTTRGGVCASRAWLSVFFVFLCVVKKRERKNAKTKRQAGGKGGELKERELNTKGVRARAHACEPSHKKLTDAERGARGAWCYYFSRDKCSIQSGALGARHCNNGGIRVQNGGGHQQYTRARRARADRQSKRSLSLSLSLPHLGVCVCGLNQVKRKGGKARRARAQGASGFGNRRSRRCRSIALNARPLKC